MNQPKVIDADSHIYENHEGSKNTADLPAPTIFDFSLSAIAAKELGAKR